MLHLRHVKENYSKGINVAFQYKSALRAVVFLKSTNFSMTGSAMKLKYGIRSSQVYHKLRYRVYLSNFTSDLFPVYYALLVTKLTYPGKVTELFVI